MLYIFIAIIIIIFIIFYLQTSKNFNNLFEHFEITQDTLYDDLVSVSQILNDNNIKYWIMYGTLLGAIREQNIIEYDYDIDFGANINDVDKILSIKHPIYKFVKSSGLVYDYNDINKTKSTWRVSIKIYNKDTEVGDIYLYKSCYDGYMRRFDDKINLYFWANSTFPSICIEQLDYVKIRNKLFPAPKYSHILLEHWYGNTWMTPIKAKAQGGNGDKNSDYYGGSLDINLNRLIEKFKELNIYLDNPYYFKSNKINYICPFEQKEWIIKFEMN